MLRTTRDLTSEAESAHADDASEVPCVPGHLQWSSGSEPPPFVASNHRAVELLARLIAGEVALPSPIWMSQAVAVQIWRLVFDGAARAAELRDVGWPGIYMILGSLSLGMRPAVDEAAVKRLQAAIERQRNASPGLGPAFKEKLYKRARDPELKGMSLEEATTHLYLTLDREPFNFTFKQAPTWITSSVAP